MSGLSVSIRRSTRSISVVALWLGACSGDYPLPPTACDEWCDATKGTSCPDSYDPAACVSHCEESRLIPPGCRTQLDALVRCFREHPSIPQMYCGPPSLKATPCKDETDEFAFCAGYFDVGGGPEQ